MVEKWRPVAGHEDAYAVSDLGRVQSVSRYVMRERLGVKPHTVYRTGVLLRPGRASNGYLTVAVAGQSRLVHELVLTTFVGLRPENYIGRHLDGVRTNNTLPNLEWSTYRQNSLDMKWHGTHAIAAFTPAEVAVIKQRLSVEGYGAQSRIAREFDVTPRCICYIANGVNYADV